MPKQSSERGKLWYVIHTQTGHEESVAENLKQRIESMDMETKIFGIMIPTEKKIRIKNDKRKTVTEKIFPGYVFVEMIVTDDSWYVVRNTPNVTGFIGTGTIPTPISDQEIQALQKRMGVQEPTVAIELTPGTPVKITDGPFKDYEGRIDEVDQTRGKVKVAVTMFGRETPIELDPLQVRQI